MSLEQVKEFHEAFGHPVASQIGTVDRSTFNLRMRLIHEELRETIRDYHLGDIVKTMDGFADMTVVINGTILVFGGYEIASQMKSYRYYGEEDFFVSEVDQMTRFFNKMFEYLSQIELFYSRNNVFGVLHLLTKMIDAIYDICDTNGVPIDKVNEAVHKANMSKLGEDGKPIYRADGKILKGPNFRPPEEDIKAILEAHGAQL